MGWRGISLKLLIIFTVYAVDVVVEDIDGVAGDIVDLVGVVASYVVVVVLVAAGIAHTGASLAVDPSYGAVVGAPELAIDLVNFVALVGEWAREIEVADGDDALDPFVELLKLRVCFNNFFKF